MQSYTFLAHTADTRVRLEADTMEGLMRVGMEAISQILHPGICRPGFIPELRKELEVRSVDKTGLLIDFLSDVLTDSHIQKAVFCDFALEYLYNHEIKATLLGKRVGCFVEDIKAITYHEAEVSQNEQGKWESMLILDI